MQAARLPLLAALLLGVHASSSSSFCGEEEGDECGIEHLAVFLLQRRSPLATGSAVEGPTLSHTANASGTVHRRQHAAAIRWAKASTSRSHRANSTTSAETSAPANASVTQQQSAANASFSQWHGAHNATSVANTTMSEAKGANLTRAPKAAPEPLTFTDLLRAVAAIAAETTAEAGDLLSAELTPKQLPRSLLGSPPDEVEPWIGFDAKQRAHQERENNGDNDEGAMTPAALGAAVGVVVGAAVGAN
mmetsp:Transcript_57042/g.132986  ORF Transcript_57042/g.132986 Transcript_57042/m.132986 type:complete len:248 (+) Transcript_57042:101-844(+)